MSNLSDDVIKSLLRTFPWPLSGVEETKTDWALGFVTISKRHPYFGRGYGGTLGPTSRFRKQWFEAADTQFRGWLVIFRAFDKGTATGDPEDVFAGWAPPEQELEVDRWVAFMNEQIKQRLAGHQGSARQARLIGFFQEHGGGDDAPSLADLRGKRDRTAKAEVLAYLRGAKKFVHSPGYERDHFDQASVAGTKSLLTDGTYAWPEFLAYYVDRYDVELPADFERHVAERGWRLPSPIDSRGLRVSR